MWSCFSLAHCLRLEFLVSSAHRDYLIMLCQTMLSCSDKNAGGQDFRGDRPEVRWVDDEQSESEFSRTPTEQAGNLLKPSTITNRLASLRRVFGRLYWFQVALQRCAMLNVCTFVCTVDDDYDNGDKQRSVCSKCVVRFRIISTIFRDSRVWACVTRVCQNELTRLFDGNVVRDVRVSIFCCDVDERVSSSLTGERWTYEVRWDSVCTRVWKNWKPHGIKRPTMNGAK